MKLGMQMQVRAGPPRGGSQRQAVAASCACVGAFEFAPAMASAGPSAVLHVPRRGGNAEAGCMLVALRCVTVCVACVDTHPPNPHLKHQGKARGGG